MLTYEEKLENLKKKKLYVYTIKYGRHNPQNGYHEHTTEIVAPTDAQAEKLGKLYCDGAIYGYNTYLGIEKKSPEVPKEFIRYREKVTKKDRYGYAVRTEPVAELEYSEEASAWKRKHVWGREE